MSDCMGHSELTRGCTECALEAVRWEHEAACNRAAEAKVQRDLAERKAERLRFALESITSEFESTIRNHLDNDGKGMQVPFHGDFAAAKRIPSLGSSLRWWAREMRSVLDGNEWGTK